MPRLVSGNRISPGYLSKLVTDQKEKSLFELSEDHLYTRHGDHQLRSNQLWCDWPSDTWEASHNKVTNEVMLPGH
ncbi:MAG TPA: hypothetical protein VF905_01370, partial [Nitrospirota bacterium]